MVALQLQLQKLGYDLEGVFGEGVHTDGIAFMYETESNSIIQ